MKNDVLKGIFWKLLERFGVSGIQFVLQIVLARLLSPEHYGALAIMIIFTNLANIFVQSGFSISLIQRKDITEEDYSSVFWVVLSIAVVLYIAIFIAAPWIAVFYNMPNIINPMRVLALMLIPGALNSVQLAKVSKELDFKKVFYSNIGGALVSGLIGILLAYYGCGLWALVTQSLLNVLMVCLVMRFTVKLRIRFVCNLERIRLLFSFGWKLLVSSLLETLYQDLQGLVIGKKYDSGTLGFYNRGQQFPQFVTNAVNGSVQSVMLPAMAVQQDDKSSLKDMMRISLSTCAYIMFPIMAGLAAIAPSLISVLLTDKWLPCVPFMQLYCFTFAFYPVHTCNLQAINAMGRSDLYLKLEIIKKIYGIVILAIAVFYFESPLAIAGTGLISTWIGWFVNSFPNKRLLGYSCLEQIKDVLPSMVMALMMCGIVLLVGKLHFSAISLLIVQIVVGVVVYLFFSFIIKPEPFKLIISQIKKILNKKAI